MSGLKSLQWAATGKYVRRYFSTTRFQHSSTGQDIDRNMKPLEKLSNQTKQKNKVTPVRYQSSQPKTAGLASTSTVNRQRYIHPSALETVDLSPLDDMFDDSVYTRNVENFVGTVKVPIGMVNVNVNGMHANGPYAVPLATTESALVASYSRGCKLINESGGINTAVLRKTVQRAPEFVFQNLLDAYKFLQWFNSPDLFPIMKQVAETTTNHGKLMKIAANLHGNKVITKWKYESGNACGQNICTFATNAAIQHILPKAPIQPKVWYLESGSSQDKKASSGFFNDTRGVYVTGEVVCPKEVVERIMKTTVDNISELNQSVLVGQHMQGCAGLTCHTANALAAVFIACGQDAACVSESHIGITEMRKTREGDLRLCITIPSLMIGTVGGGTSLPSQKTCLDMLQLPKESSRDAFAEVILGVLLGGEVSLTAAVTAHQFSTAHHKYARQGTGISNRT
ncbi:3-hydroxy-3-methylglutaryl-coenzyme A reductase 1-like isoform X1 [Anneissia japonica]|uniref:3-hydroxy-3-methylglutaryl-coenzyme A reductase 1-like isoform X1 n=1 Tax=Anneissia japonica TaxID=1529436 RepID=UPI0014259A1E|nr:3-hydroxy-3-methylglutaryl-coenzyme A reductase 1-like isoform X1 [Anneissia japonica]